MSLDQDRERLKKILQDVSVRRGKEFTLASGKKSTVYVDARVTTLKAEAMPLIGRLFLAKIEERGWKPDAVGGLTMGADPVVSAIAHCSVGSDRVIDAFIVRKAAKKHGMQRQIEGLGEREGLDVVVVEDVATTGGSASQAIDACRAGGFNVLGAISLVDREEGAAEHIEQEMNCSFDRVFRLSEL
jgi:orotate phosphoribosyltransferase